MTDRSASTSFSNLLHLDKEVLQYQLLRSSRRSLSLQIDSRGLIVRAPAKLAQTYIEDVLRQRSAWIFAKLKIHFVHCGVTYHWQDGALFQYFGQTMRLKFLSNLASGVQLDLGEGLICIGGSDDPKLIQVQMVYWMRQQALVYFRMGLACFAAQMNVRSYTLKLTNATTRWGSCNQEGKIRLSWRLLHFSPELIDYVQVHELAHRFEMNHGARFWAQVGRVFPNYDWLRKALRTQALALPPYWQTKQ